MTSITPREEGVFPRTAREHSVDDVGGTYRSHRGLSMRVGYVAQKGIFDRLRCKKREGAEIEWR